MSPSNNRKPTDHTAKAAEGVREWTRSPKCAVPGCERTLVWVLGSGRKSARWQHERTA